MSKVVIQGNASGTGNFTIAAPNSNTDRTLTLPDTSGTLVTGDDIAINGITSDYTSGTALNVDSNGIVTKPNQPMFRVRPSAALYHGQTTTKIPFDIETFDVGSNFDSTTNYRFVAPVAGKYTFTFSTLISVGTGQYSFVRGWFYKNGASYNDGLGDEGTYGTYQRLHISDSIDLSANDYVEVFLTAASASAYMFASYTWFTGFLIG